MANKPAKDKKDTPDVARGGKVVIPMSKVAKIKVKMK